MDGEVVVTGRIVALVVEGGEVRGLEGVGDVQVAEQFAYLDSAGGRKAAEHLLMMALRQGDREAPTP